PTLDEDQLARFLVDAYHERRRTLLADVDAVTPGRVVELRRSSRNERRFWKPDPTVAQGRAEVHAERLREALDAAVRDRLRGPGPVSALVSGGIDSSSIAVVAHAIAGAGCPDRLLHLAFPGLACDEARYVAAVADAVGAPIV